MPDPFLDVLRSARQGRFKVLLGMAARACAITAQSAPGAGTTFTVLLPHERSD